MNVFVTRPIPEIGLQLLYEAAGKENVRVSACDRAIARTDLLAAMPGTTGLLCHLSDAIDAEVMDAAGGTLNIIANYAVGYNNIDLSAARQRGIFVTNTPGVLTDATADLAWTLLMGAARRVGEAERFLRSGAWEGWGPNQFLGGLVHGKTLGVFGMGRIGQAVAKRAAGFSMNVLYYSRTHLPMEQESMLQARWVNKETLLAESDFISIHCPLTDETRHAFTLNEFKQMKRTAVLVNTSRGPVVKEDDLCQALEENLLFAAGLDVYEHEPVIHPGLFRQERALILPHLGSAATETRNAMAVMAANNIAHVAKGMTPPNLVQTK